MQAISYFQPWIQQSGGKKQNIWQIVQDLKQIISFSVLVVETMKNQLFQTYGKLDMKGLKLIIL